MEDLKPIRGDSQQTEGLRECIRRLVDEKIRNHGAANRHRDTHAKSVALVKCGSLKDDVDGLYEGTVRLIRGLDLTYQDQHGPAWLLDANGSQLQPGMTYQAIRYGDHTLDGGNSSRGDTRPVYVCQQSGAGSEMRIIRTFAGMTDPAPDTASDYITAPFSCALRPDSPPIFYLATTVSYAGGCTSDDCLDSIETCNLIWATPLYQPAYTGGTTYANLVAGMPYIALNTGDVETFVIDTHDGPPVGSGPPTSNIQAITAPVYIVGVLPARMVCDGTTPMTIVAPY